MTRRNSVVDSYRVFVIGITVITLLSAGPALGQFIVQPMVLELTAPPGQLVTHNLELQNHDPNNTMDVVLTVADLSQEEDGSWLPIEPNTPDANVVDISKLFSCRSWTSLSQQTVQIKPLTIIPVRVALRVPRGIRGFYSAGIVVVLKAGTIGDVGLVFNFVVPVLVQVPGRVVPHDVELTDVGMAFREPSREAPATTTASMSIVNKGQTYSRLQGMVRVWGRFADHWRRITERELRLAGILPGSAVKLEGDIGRSLPPGKYRVAGWLYVDGRRVRPIEKEIDFAGDPSVSRLATDAALDVSPREIIINSLPGATRTTAILVANASDEEVNVQVAKALPPVLMGVAVGPLRGEDLSCTGWLGITPTQFKLSAYGQQNILINSKMPNPEAIYACYYALLGLFATYPDGRNAGLTTAPICIVNKTIQGKPQPGPSGPVNLALQTGSKYIITSTFTNYGNIHFTPGQCYVTIANPAGLAMEQMLLRGGPGGIMLPLESRPFSGELDFSTYPAGFYRVEVGLEYGPKQVAINQVGIEVSVQGTQRVIRLVGREEFEKIGVKWR